MDNNDGGGNGHADNVVDLIAALQRRVDAKEQESIVLLRRFFTEVSDEHLRIMADALVHVVRLFREWLKEHPDA